MVHYTCDMCGKPILTGDEIRYVVKIEIYSTCDAMEADDDTECDIWEIEEENDRADCEDAENFADDDSEFKTFRFDLCNKCHKRYLQDPLSLKTWHRTRFSEN